MTNPAFFALHSNVPAFPAYFFYLGKYQLKIKVGTLREYHTLSSPNIKYVRRLILAGRYMTTG